MLQSNPPFTSSKILQCLEWKPKTWTRTKPIWKIELITTNTRVQGPFVLWVLTHCFTFQTYLYTFQYTFTLHIYQKHPNTPYSNLITKRPQLIVFCKEALVGLGVLWLCVIAPFVQLYGVVVEVLIFIWVSSVWALVAVGCVATAEVEEDWESQLVFSREVKKGVLMSKGVKAHWVPYMAWHIQGSSMTKGWLSYYWVLSIFISIYLRIYFFKITLIFKQFC